MARTGTLSLINGLRVVPDLTPEQLSPPEPLVAVESLLAELLLARAAIAGVRAHHRMVGTTTGKPWCVDDGQPWPCPTTQALDNPAPTSDDAA